MIRLQVSPTRTRPLGHYYLKYLKSNADHETYITQRREKTLFHPFRLIRFNNDGLKLRAMTLDFVLDQLWRWTIERGVDFALLFIAALLVPRAGRLAHRWSQHRSQRFSHYDESKSSLAVAGVAIYIAQLITYFVLFVFFLQQLGFSLVGATIPATAASAAVGLGAQSIIADFLAGFFILSEKQYGIGDWVKFEGNGIEVEGTIIQVTMRATRIRTLNEETIIIPNSTARVCINHSHYWSSAVVVMPVPLLEVQSPWEAVERFQHATQRALRVPEISEVLKGELEIHPAVGKGINPPAVVGMPWTVNIRAMILTEAGMQWMVERAIRLAVLDEFWNEYGSAPTINGDLQDEVTHRTRQNYTPDTSGAYKSIPWVDLSLATPSPEENSQEITELTAQEAELYHRFDPRTFVDKLFSLNGRLRPSTTGLSLLFIALLVIRVLGSSIEIDGEIVHGPLAPAATESTLTVSTN